MKAYKAIIIGSGQSGTPLSRKLAAAGWKTALIERRWLGGTCVNDGCTPTKAMISSAKMAYQAGRSSDYGIETAGYTVNMPAVIARKEKIVLHSRTGIEKGIKETPNLDLYEGSAAFTGEKRLLVTLKDGRTEELGAGYIFINTGTRTSIPPIKDLDKIPYFTATSLLEYKEIPEHLIIIGGGPIGLEFGQMYKRFGSRVTILEQGDRFLSREDEDIAGAMFGILSEEGIDIRIKARADRVGQEERKIALTATIDGKEQRITGSHLLLAAGRTPNTEELNLEATGVETDDKGYISVNKRLETNIPGIFAMGDVKGGPAFTHISYNDYVVLSDDILNNGYSSAGNRMVPYCIFTDPELGRIGLTEAEARKQGLSVKVARLPMEHVARGIETGETKGLMKAVVDADSRKILGAAILGSEGGEIMSVLQMAMLGGVTGDVISKMILAHPTFAESLNNLFSQLE
ncbi:mercuric reductase [Compostibacter hankyongensis]|uniref:Mercuric reductase n=1 Tax=Compostibacter hankyongensis TaxID=1007089 RepID=A0ABP8FPY0_9BACT